MHIGGTVCDLTKGTMKHGAPLRINSKSEPILFAGDTSALISSRNLEDLCSVSNLVLSHMIKWFAASKLVTNLDKTNIIKFITKKSSHLTLCIGCKSKVYRRDSTFKISWITN
jgi:hypothetical protein